MEEKKKIQRIANAFATKFYETLVKETNDPLEMFDEDTISSVGEAAGPTRLRAVGRDKQALEVELAVFRGCELNIISVDTQETFDDGLLVFVTAWFSGGGGNPGAVSSNNSTGAGVDRRFFAQTFLLGKDEEGRFYIRNTLIRFLAGASVVTTPGAPAGLAASHAKADPAPASKPAAAETPAAAAAAPVTTTAAATAAAAPAAAPEASAAATNKADKKADPKPAAEKPAEASATPKKGGRGNKDGAAKDKESSSPAPKEEKDKSKATPKKGGKAAEPKEKDGKASPAPAAAAAAPAAATSAAAPTAAGQAPAAAAAAPADAAKTAANGAPAPAAPSSYAAAAARPASKTAVKQQPRERKQAPSADAPAGKEGKEAGKDGRKEAGKDAKEGGKSGEKGNNNKGARPAGKDAPKGGNKGERDRGQAAAAPNGRSDGLNGAKKKKKDDKQGAHINMRAQCYVSNIAFESTNEALFQLLNRFGEVTDIIRPPNKGYGFVEFRSDEDAKNAIANPGKVNLVLDGRELKIEERTGQAAGNGSGAAKDVPEKRTKKRD